MIVVEQITGTRAAQLQREIIEVSPSVVIFSFQSDAYLDKETYDPQGKQTDIFAEIENKVDNDDERLSDSREWTADTVEQAEAEAGTATIRRAWTAERVRQAITAWWDSISIAISKVTGLQEALSKAQKEIAGIIEEDYADVGPHTFTILPEHSGKSIHIQAVADADVDIVVDNDIEINQPITIRKTGEFTLRLEGANDDIVIEANDVDIEEITNIQSVDISGETINTVQIMKASENVIWGIGI